MFPNLAFINSLLITVSVLLSAAVASIPTRQGSCPPGYRINQDKCFECFPGSYASGQSDTCRLCPKDFYMPNYASDFCWPCPNGRKTTHLGSSTVEMCLDGSGRGPHQQNTETIVIVICLLTALVSLGAIIAVLYFFLTTAKRNIRTQTLPRIHQIRPKKDSLFKKEAEESEEHIYASIPAFDSQEKDNVYENFGVIESHYEEPIQREPAEYIEIFPDLPPKKQNFKRLSKSSEQLHYSAPTQHSRISLNDPE